ncbi:MAG TPA: M23 family metallopeptidase [Patescibacteria group bacterium]|nr:M23 family metallopeptidase [Patescibacteria group bacterium]
MPPRSRFKAGLLTVLVLILAIVAPISYLGWRQTVPGVHATLAVPRFIGHTPAFTVTLDASRGNIARAEVRVVQGGRPVTVAKSDAPLGPRAQLPVRFEAASLGLREGAATVEVWARDDFWRPFRGTERAVASTPVTIDLTPPKLEILAATRYVSPGGVQLVAFRVSDAQRTDVTVGQRAFPSFAYGPPDKGARVALVALPYDYAAGTPIAVTARDEAGNVAARGVPGELKPRAFPRDTIKLSEAFLQAKVPELLPQRPPSQPLLDGFLVINREQRKQAETTKREVGAKTAETPLWQGPFVQPRNTKVFSNFAETRTYLYEGRAVDTQVHYGYDLASTKQSPVPAANSGVVAFAGPLTIYGNAVVLDHGLGLQTLYAHLSSIEVKVGDRVTKGQELGRTGATGLAIGDHLHFEVLVSGVSVTPLEWWDAKWIRDRVNRPLKEAGLPEIAGVGPVADDEPARPVRATRRRAR